MTPSRMWEVCLLGGASGMGKSSISYRLAQQFGVGITEVDDLYIAIEKMTTPEQQPLFHYWATHPEAMQMSAEEILELHLSVCRGMSPAFEGVIANHLESHTPVVLEGDYLLPELLAKFKGEVQGVFLYEDDKDQLVSNYLTREPLEGPQTGRAQVSWLYGQWLKADCERLGLTALPSRPWETTLERVIEALQTGK
jgi:2-phosphoglycerate kinase